MEIKPTLLVAPTTSGVRIVAHLHAARPRELEWRLTVDTLGPGGRSRVAQRGRTSCDGDDPLAEVQVNARGAAELEIFEQGVLVGAVHASF